MSKNHNSHRFAATVRRRRRDFWFSSHVHVISSKIKIDMTFEHDNLLLSLHSPSQTLARDAKLRSESVKFFLFFKIQISVMERRREEESSSDWKEDEATRKLCGRDKITKLALLWLKSEQKRSAERDEMWLPSLHYPEGRRRGLAPTCRWSN